MDRKAAESNASVLPKACENCRIRKIRCNRVIPCSNCATSGIECKVAARTEPRSRVLLSANYEKQVEQINGRLSRIEDAIEDLRRARPSPAILPDDLTATMSNPMRSQTLTSAAFEGASSFTSQALQASQAAGRSFKGIRGSAEVHDALSSLHNIVETPSAGGNKQDTRFGDAVTTRDLPDVQLLPVQFVLKLLQVFKNRVSAIFLAYAFRDHGQLERLCQKAYFPVEPLSLASLTLMNGMLMYMIKELMFEGDHEVCKGYDLKAYHDQAERNFHRGIETYELLAQPSLEGAKAIMLATMKAQEEGNPLLSWTFAMAGCRQVISLGLHRRNTVKNDPFDIAEDKRQVFWSYYIVDKNLSLNMGYASTIQDYDIDTEYFQISTDPGVAPWDEAALAMVEFSRVQGLIYEKLYSLRALRMSGDDRSAAVHDLSCQLQIWHQEWTQIDGNSAYLPTFFFLIYGAFDVVYYSVMTTLNRAATASGPSIEITSACYEAAKESLQAHLHFFPAFRSYGNGEVLASYLAWILLYASWTPLIVVFLHAIASSSQDDVKLLEETEESLEPLKKLNRQSEQMYGLCKNFHKLAKHFVEQHSTFVGTYNPQQDMVVFPQKNMEGNPANVQSMPSMQYANGQWGGGPEVQIPSSDGPEIDGMSMFLGNWLGTNQPVSNLWMHDFAENVEE